MAAASTPDNATQGEEGAAQGEDGATQGEEVDEFIPSPSSGKRPTRPVQGPGKKAKTANAVLIQEAVTNVYK
ncbi:hypothetical protein E2562_029009 [Oryza meyeriana var. granulata]|uniref:Uncharacterized protein n=1 Tax=Oryza meyeriana var. granulata TaxID=110450 RepID=A0A6G1E376_9ORYZ|nr:hypothetical protein E2562_029009 [Oryza meyeriana var. granulata]